MSWGRSLALVVASLAAACGEDARERIGATCDIPGGVERIPGEYLVMLQRGVEALAASEDITSYCGGIVLTVWEALGGFGFRCEVHPRWLLDQTPPARDDCARVVPCVERDPRVRFVERNERFCAIVAGESQR